MTAPPPVALEPFEEVVASAPQVMVGVRSRRGPHVTPELFALASGRIWCLTAATTLKVKVLDGGGPVAVAATTKDGRSALAIGRATVLDPARPIRNLGSLVTSLTSPVAVGRFAARNAAELTGTVVDLLQGKLGGPLPPRRVVVCIEPTAYAVVDGGAVSTSAGWERDASGGAHASAARRADGASDDGGEDDEPDTVLRDLADVDGVPEALRSLTDDGPAFVGFLTNAGAPLVLPAAWEAASRRARVASGLIGLTGASPSSPACVTRDRWVGFGPSGKLGVMLRGRGTVAEEAEPGTIDFELTGAAYWHGIETGRVTDERAPS